MPIGRVLALYLFEVGDSVDVQAIRTLVGTTVVAPLTAKSASPPYLQYQQPPVVIDGTEVGGRMDDLHVRFTVYDYGIISVGFTGRLPGSWDEIVELGPQGQANPPMPPPRDPPVPHAPQPFQPPAPPPPPSLS